MSVLENLERELTERKIAARLIENQMVLTVYLPPELIGREAFGDIYFRPFTDEEDGGELWF